MTTKILEGWASFKSLKVGFGMFNPDHCAVSVSETHGSPVTIARDLKAATSLPGQKCAFNSRLGETGLGA
jgi:hypothetical protein